MENYGILVSYKKNTWYRGRGASRCGFVPRIGIFFVGDATHVNLLPPAGSLHQAGWAMARSRLRREVAISPQQQYTEGIQHTGFELCSKCLSTIDVLDAPIYSHRLIMYTPIQKVLYEKLRGRGQTAPAARDGSYRCEVITGNETGMRFRSFSIAVICS